MNRKKKNDLRTAKAEEEQNENATSDEDTPVSAKEHETGGDPVSM
ncbi:hypothetical protein VINI7043_29380, partial [Vibrio nigripulchritudo ATCC 27043]